MESTGNPCKALEIIENLWKALEKAVDILGNPWISLEVQEINRNPWKALEIPGNY